MKHLCSQPNNHLSKKARFGLFGILTFFTLLFCACDGASIFASRPDREDYDPIFQDQLACRELVKVEEVTSYKNHDYGPKVWEGFGGLSLNFIYNFSGNWEDRIDRPLMQRAMQKMASYDKTYWTTSEEKIRSNVYNNWRRATHYYIQHALYNQCESRKLFPDFKEFDAQFQETFGALETEIEELKELRALWIRRAIAVFNNINDEECDYSELINDTPKDYQQWHICKRTGNVERDLIFHSFPVGGCNIVVFFNENKKRTGLKLVDNIYQLNKDNESVTIDDLEEE